MRTVVVGDVHGCADELRQLIEEARADRVISVGDLFTKGPSPVGVWELIVRHNIDAVLGNHEQRLLDYIDGLRNHDTAARSCIAHLDRGAPGWREWTRALPLYREVHGWIVVHAALESAGGPFTPKRVAINRRRTGAEHDAPYWWEVYHGDHPVVYGHDAVRGPVRVEKNGRPFIIGLDSGCVYGGTLSGYILEEDRLVRIKAAKAYKPVKGKAA
jgi:hypothetical protein